MHKKLSIVVGCIVAGWVMPAAAEDIYRCGDSYSQQPCPGGKLVLTEDARSASQRSQTSLAVQRDAKAADAMEKARLKEEEKPAQAALPPARPQEIPEEEAKAVSFGKPKKSPYFTAVSPRKPGDAKAKKKKAKKKIAA